MFDYESFKRNAEFVSFIGKSLQLCGNWTKETFFRLNWVFLTQVLDVLRGRAKIVHLSNTVFGADAPPLIDRGFVVVRNTVAPDLTIKIVDGKLYAGGRQVQLFQTSAQKNRLTSPGLGLMTPRFFSEFGNRYPLNARFMAHLMVYPENIPKEWVDLCRREGAVVTIVFAGTKYADSHERVRFVCLRASRGDGNEIGDLTVDSVCCSDAGGDDCYLAVLEGSPV
jgi:hypothetical protein